MGPSLDPLEFATGVSRPRSGSNALAEDQDLILPRFIPLPKSDTKERIVANFDVFDFELSEAQMGKLNALDQDEHVCLNPTDCP